MTAQSHHLAITRTARIFTIGQRQDVRDLWVVCHGYGQLAGRFIANFAALEAPGRLIAAPEGLHRFYLDPPPAPAKDRRVGATWMTREDRESDIKDYVAYLDAVVDEMVRESTSAPRVHVLGFSQGTATVMRWAAQGRQSLDRIVLWAGEVPGDVDLGDFKARQPNARVALVVGANDKLATDKMVRMHGGRLSQAGLVVTYHEHAGGHHLDTDLLHELVAG